MSPSHSAPRKHIGPQLLRPYKCSVCYKTFQKQNHLTRHIKIHSDERQHKCPYCGKAFLRSDNLKKHVRIHTGEKFPCPFCDRGFTDSSNLTKHIRTHTGEGRHRCKFCLKHFAGLTALQRHMQEHEEEMLFAMDTSLVKIERTDDTSNYLSYIEQNGHLNEKEPRRPAYPLLPKRNQNSSSEEPYLDKRNSVISNLLLVKTERTDASDYLSYMEQNGQLNKELFQQSERPASPLLPKRNQNSSDEPYLDKTNSFNSNRLPQYQEPVILDVSRKVEKTVDPFKGYLQNVFDDTYPSKHFQVLPQKSSPHLAADKCPIPFALKDQRFATQVKVSTPDLLQELTRPLNTNQDVPLWQCVLCLEEFSSCFPLLSHLKRHVTDGVQIPGPWDQDNSVATEEGSSLEQLNCRYCQTVFTQQSELLTHMDLKLCKHCGKTFACSMLLENHKDACEIDWMDKESNNKYKNNYNNAVSSKSSEIPVENYQETDAENETLDTKEFPLLTAVKQEIIFSDTENAVPDHHISTSKSLLAVMDLDLSLNKTLSPSLTSPIKDDHIDSTQMITDANILTIQQKTHPDSGQEISTETIPNNLKKSQVFDSGITASLDILPKPEPLDVESILVNPEKPLTLLDSQLQNIGQDIPDSTKDLSLNMSVYEAYKCAKAAINDPNGFQHQNLYSSSSISESNIQPFWCQNCGKHFQSMFEFREHLKSFQKFINKFCPENSNKLAALKMCLNTHLPHSVSDPLERNLVSGDAHLEPPDSENPQIQSFQPQSQRVQPQSQRVQPQSQSFQPQSRPVQPQSQPVQPPTVALNANNNTSLLTCNVCRKTFARTTQLNRHLKIHSGIKNHKCNFCSKTFLRSDNLRKHLRIHLGIKQYACTVCKRRFTDSSNLVKHQRIHNVNRQGYFCNLCCRSFLSYKGFCKHNETHEPSLIEWQSTVDERFTDINVGSASPTLIDGQSTADEHCTDNNMGSASAKIPQKTVFTGRHTRNNLQIKTLDANVCDKPTVASQSSETNQFKALKMELARKVNFSISKNGNLPDASSNSGDLSSHLKHSTEPKVCSSNSSEQNQISSKSSKFSPNPKYERFCPSPCSTTQSLVGDQLNAKKLELLISSNGANQSEKPKLEKKEQWNNDDLQIIVPLSQESSATLKSVTPELSENSSVKPNESSSVNTIFASLTEKIKDNLTLDMVVGDKRTYCSPQLESSILEQQQVPCNSEINTINIKSDQNLNISTRNLSSQFASCDSARKEPVSKNSNSDLPASSACFIQNPIEDKLEMSAYYNLQTSPNNLVKPITQESELLTSLW